MIHLIYIANTMATDNLATNDMKHLYSYMTVALFIPFPKSSNTANENPPKNLQVQLILCPKELTDTAILSIPIISLLYDYWCKNPSILINDCYR